MNDLTDTRTLIRPSDVDPARCGILLDLPEESVQAMIDGLISTVRDETTLEIRVERELLREPRTDHLMLVVHIPESATEEQRAEADYWINEMLPLYRYANQPTD